MADQKPKTPEVIVEPVSDMDRDLDMLMMHIRGATYQDCATKYGLSRAAVSKIAKRDNWESILLEVKTKKFNELLQSFKDSVARAKRALDADLDLLVDRAQGKKRKKQFTKDERAFLMKYIEMGLHETRLEDGKPTEHHTGVVEHTLRLPPGVKHSFIIPPDRSMRILPAEEETKKIDYSVVKEKLDDDDKR